MIEMLHNLRHDCCKGLYSGSGLLGRLDEVLLVEVGQGGVLEQEEACCAVCQAAAALEAQPLKLCLQPVQAQRLQLCRAAILGEIHRLCWGRLQNEKNGTLATIEIERIPIIMAAVQY